MSVVVLFYHASSPLSNAHPSPIQFGGHTYPTAEHCFQALKAIEFGDRKTLAAIRAADSPGWAGKLGREVKPYDDVMWKAVRRERMFAVLMAKFDQNAKLRGYLIATGKQQIGEANGRDELWGIGLWETHPEAQNPRMWPGENLLGEQIMRVRRLYVKVR